MSKCVLFIDGENFNHKVMEVLKEEGLDKTKVDLASIDLHDLFKGPLHGFKIGRKIFYAARLHIHPATKKKSEELIKLQRKLRNYLINQGYEFIIAGNVRAQKVVKKHPKLPIMEYISISEYHPKYHDQAKQLVFSVLRELRPGYKPESDPRNRDLDAISEVYTGKGKFWVALEEEKVIGTIAVQESSPEKAHLKRLFVLKQNRGKGIGKKLLQQALDHCRAKHFKEITLITSSYAQTAQIFFRNFGFEKTNKTFRFDKELVHYRLKL